MHRRGDAVHVVVALIALAAGLGVHPCAVAPAGEMTAEGAPTVEEILNTKPRPEDYVTEERCVRPSRIDRTEILNERLIVFHLRGDEKFLLQFAQRCPGLRRGVTLRYEKGNQHRICEHDTVQAFFEMGGGQGRWGPRCLLPAFHAVSAEQVEYLKAEIRINVPSPEASETGS